MKIGPSFAQNGVALGSGEIDFALAAFETVRLGDPERACLRE